MKRKKEEKDEITIGKNKGKKMKKVVTVSRNTWTCIQYDTRLILACLFEGIEVLVKY